MTGRTEVELILDRYLADGPERVADRVIDVALDQVDHKPQRRATRVPWRYLEMTTLLKPALAGAAIVAVLLVGVLFLDRGMTGPGAAPVDPSPSPSPSASPTADPTDTADWKTYTSARYGYQMDYPLLGIASAASRDWELTDRNDNLTPGADKFMVEGPPESFLVTAFADDLPAGMAQAEWSAAYWEGAPEACTPSGPNARPITVGGVSGTLVDRRACGEGAHVVVFIDSRVHVFAIWREDQDDILEAFVSTVSFP